MFESAAVPLSAYIHPLWIFRFDQCDLLRATPTFQLLLAQDSSSDIRELFKIDQAIDTVGLGETVDLSLLVLSNTTHHAVRDADIQRSRKAREDVNVEPIGPRHS